MQQQKFNESKKWKPIYYMRNNQKNGVLILMSDKIDFKGENALIKRIFYNVKVSICQESIMIYHNIKDTCTYQQNSK